MEYGIKLKNKLTEGGFYAEPTPRSMLSEHVGPGSQKVLTFKTQADAEVYAQNHEISNYTIERV